MLNVSRLLYSAIVISLVTFIPQANADITSALGEQDFADGHSPILAGEFASAGVGEPYPFDGTIFGSDPDGTFGDLSYTHIFSLAGQSVLSSSITIGLSDHDSFPGSGDTIDIFFDGVQQDDSMWIGISQSPSSVSVRSMTVDPFLLLDESLTVQIVATVAAAGFTGNGIGVDYSLLSIEPVPVPGAVLLGMLGLSVAGIKLHKSV